MDSLEKTGHGIEEVRRQTKRLSRQLRRDLVAEATERLLEKKPFSAVTVTDVAKEAGMSPASIYLYFKDRAELFTFLALRFADRLGHAFRQAMADADGRGRGDGLRKALGVLHTEFRKHPNLFAVTMFEGLQSLGKADTEHTSKEQRDEMTEQAQAAVAPLLEAVAQGFELSIQDSIDFVVQVRMMAMGVLLDAYKEYPMHDSSRDVEGHLELVVAGALAIAEQMREQAEQRNAAVS
ncbi:MAG: TetR/AcrR family transcriptional regulator [Deltaproteobacteria bacterium]